MNTLLMLLGLLRLTGYATDPLLEREQVHAIVGEPSRIDPVPPTDGRLTVVSWNIAQGVRYENVRDALAALDADFYLLQEVDMGARRSGYRSVAKDLAHDLGLNWVFAGEFQEIGESRRNIPALTGQAVLSRYPIRNAFALPFANQARLRWRLDPFQPRKGGRMALRAESSGVLLYNAHIESAKDDWFRHKQVDEVVVDNLGPARTDLPVVFAGDFNTGRVPDKSPIVRCLIDEGFVDALGASGPRRRTSVNHAQPLDWIFLRNLMPQQGRVIEVPEASDHFPLQATISIGSAVELAADVGPLVSARVPGSRLQDGQERQTHCCPDERPDASHQREAQSMTRREPKHVGEKRAPAF
jgi:endonuclease/exonuclease/phosphatase family metal-dependent hydrolase